MKLSLGRICAATILGLLVAFIAGCTLANKIRAKNELNESARTYKEGHFEDAEQHAKRALELDPDNKTAPIFIARIIHQQYKPGIDAPDNIAKAHEAIDAYKRVLERDPNSDEAYRAVSVLYSALKDDDALRNWIAKRASDTTMKDAQRAEAYAILAGMDHKCANQITEASDVKTVEGSQVIYKKPKDPKDFGTASKCVLRGLEEANQAIKFDPSSEAAWAVETNLFIEQAKLAEMDGKPDQKQAAQKKADEAGKRVAALADRRRKREEEEAQKSASPAGG